MADNTKIETWIPVPSTEYKYAASSFGRIKSSRGIINGYSEKYSYVSYRTSSGKYKKYYFHRMIAEVFVSGYSAERCHVNHKNGDRGDNRPENLEWVTQRENNRHAYRNRIIPSGENHHWSKLSDSAVSNIKSLKGVISQKEIANIFKTTPSNVSAILRGVSHNKKRRESWV